MLPVWLLIVPTVTHGIMQYMIGTATSTITSQVLRRYYRQDQQKQVVRLLYYYTVAGVLVLEIHDYIE